MVPFTAEIPCITAQFFFACFFFLSLKEAKIFVIAVYTLANKHRYEQQRPLIIAIRVNHRFSFSHFSIFRTPIRWEKKPRGKRKRETKEDCIIESSVLPNCPNSHVAFGGRIFRARARDVCKWSGICARTHRNVRTVSSVRREIYNGARTTPFFSRERNILLQTPGYRRSGL